MGLLFSKPRPALTNEPREEDSSPVREESLTPLKRKYELEEKAATDDDEPPGKRMQTTCKYIYEKLYVEGEGSDIEIFMLGKDWKLHRLYIQQCGYFSSMLSGCWTEGHQDRIVVNIVDDNITAEALELAIGCLYFGEAKVNKDNVVSVLATAMFLQIPDLVKTCRQVMKDDINSETVLNYYSVAMEYCEDVVSKACFDWLLVNLTYAMKESRHVRNIPPKLLLQLVLHKNLFVVNCEMSLYLLLRKWIFYYIHRNVDDAELTSTPETYFKEAKQPLYTSYDDDTNDGDKTISIALSSLRLRDLVMHSSEIQTILEDQIFSHQVLFKEGFYNLQQLLFIDQRMDRGLSTSFDDETFNKYCTRHGRFVPSNDPTSWRWSGFKYGMDLHFIQERYTLRMKWNTFGPQCLIVNKQSKRKILYKLSIACLNDQLQPIHFIKWSITSLSLAPNVEVTLANLPRALEYPVIFSFKVCVSSHKQVMGMMIGVNPPAD